MVIITEYIVKHELKPLRRYFTIEDILEGCRKVSKQLAIEIKPPQKLSGYRFYKVRIGKKTTGRMIVFVLVNNRKIVPIFIRLKKDKIFGMNMAMNNPAVVQQINIKLDRVLKDIEKKKYEDFRIL